MLNNSIVILLLASFGTSQLLVYGLTPLALLRPILSSCSPETLSNDATPIAPFLPGSSTASPTRGLDFVSWAHLVSPTGSQIVISFLPELTLAFMITYLIGVVATELAANRAPKALAIECWRAACCALAFVAFLYFIQLLGPIQNGPAVNDYLYISQGLTASKLFVTLTSLFVLHLSGGYIREHTRHILEFSIVILIGVLLLLILVSANNLMLLFLSLAGFSLNLYILVLYDGADAASREASLKYFYLSTLSAGLILFGVLLIYTMVGDVTYYAIRSYMGSHPDSHAKSVMSTGVLFILLGFFFKLSAFPGHLWAVEVYEGSPLPVMAFFILPVKVAVFITFLRLLNTGLLDFSHIWLPCVTLSAIGSLIWGALAATQSRKTTRFLGYASINQIGFLLLGLVVDTDDGLRSAFFYLVLYAVMTGGFLLVFTHLRKAKGQTLLALSDFRGLGKVDNIVCWNLSIFLFSMAGIPPLAGFLGKYYLLTSIMERGLFVPVIVALGVSLITAYYYLRVIKVFWFEEDIAVKPPVLLLSSGQRVMLSALEASIWATAAFAPWLLPAATEIVTTLTVCGDISVQGTPLIHNPVLSPPEVIHTAAPGRSAL
jgi:NADH-quinone oxidoreductase subunit N